MALGVPQLADDNPGAREFIENQVFVFCFLFDSIEAVAVGVSRLLADKTLRKKMSQRCRELRLSMCNDDRQFEPGLTAF